MAIVDHVHGLCVFITFYFLGVMLLEILVRKFPSRYPNSAQGGTDLVLWPRSAVAEGREGDRLDFDLANTDDSMQQRK